MRTYREFRPTGFDSAGAFLSDRQTWIVAPVTRNRDSGTLDLSNFRVALDSLGGESETVEVHRFGHWANGWFEIILVDPSDGPRVRECKEIEGSLENYPILSEEDYSSLEWERASETWESMGMRYRIETCQRFDLSVFAARRDSIPDDSGTCDIVHYLADGN